MKLFETAAIKKWDEFTLKEQKISSLELMERAAIVFSKKLLSLYYFKNVVVLCGPGNNGGDGYAVARLLSSKGISTAVIYAEAPKTSDCEENFKRLPKEVKIVDLKKLNEYDLIVDALFGIGFSGVPRDNYAELITKTNDSEAITVSIDMPSGLHSDHINQINETIIKADSTITFEQPKRAFYFSQNEVFIGKLHSISIGLSEDFNGPSWAHLISSENLRSNVKSSFAHKGDFGRLQIIGGFDKMAGAITLAAKAGYRAGAGYVFCLCSEFSQNIVLQHCPEVIVNDNIDAKVSGITIGMGLGQSTEAESLLLEVLKLKRPTIIDADAINILAKKPELLKLLAPDTILTPHFAELQRLLRTEQNDNELILEKQIEMSKQYGVFIVQKGKYTKITTPNGELFINPTGNNGMAVAGSGDVLSGIIGSLLAQGFSALDATLTGVYAHGLAGDLEMNAMGPTGMLPSDYLDRIPGVLSQL